MNVRQLAEERVQYEIVRARRYKVPLSILVVSGGTEGTPEPQILEEVANQARGADVVLPYTANMVLVVLTHTGLDGALCFARRAVDALADVGALAGLSTAPSGPSEGTDLLREAMEALAEASADDPLRTYGEQEL